MESFRIAYLAFLDISKNDLLRTSYRYAASTGTRDSFFGCTRRGYCAFLPAGFGHQTDYCELAVCRRDTFYFRSMPYATGLYPWNRSTRDMDLAQIDERHQLSYTSFPLAPSGWDPTPMKYTATFSVTLRHITALVADLGVEPSPRRL